MAYSYYAPHHQQRYPPLYSVPHPQQQHQASQPPQFQHQLDGEHFDPAFQNLDTFHFDPSTLLGASASPPLDSYAKPMIDPQTSDCSGSNSNGVTRITSENGFDEVPADQNLPRSSSEEKESLTPAQSKRKQQNRAAQRAFRERKERRVRDLEQELTEYKSNYSSLMEDNESLKRQIAKFATENEILRATSNSAQGNRGGNGHDSEPTTTGPLGYTPTDYNGEKKEPAHRIAVSRTTGEKLLDASATWDLIVNHLSKQGLKLDVQDIYDRLKAHTQCDGQGPVVEESLVLQAIEDSIAAGSDELI
ncbi:hypothetical protein AJ79_02604 [Helicocarpus griseus UAMH5409]|uniref:BZIP domain-containing protein n=1 Tax=Helicocarpus griseus UAMH5409 TaxID=1447875 RepID=A0A2B7Y2N9_9EURO|nr:hypothetical protein AJ79_02604 [Helicocarpus griseus UAMH5409]